MTISTWYPRVIEDGAFSEATIELTLMDDGNIVNIRGRKQARVSENTKLYNFNHILL